MRPAYTDVRQRGLRRRQAGARLLDARPIRLVVDQGDDLTRPDLRLTQPGSWREGVEAILACQDRYPAVGEVARQLGCSERGLRRHLSAEDCSYAGLVDRIRHIRACYLLTATGLRLEEIAARLHYSEAAAFTHAFRRWAGRSPSAYRAEPDTCQAGSGDPPR